MDELIINYYIEGDKIIINYLNSKEVIDYRAENINIIENKIKRQYDNISINDLKEQIYSYKKKNYIAFFTLPSFIGLTIVNISIFTFPISLILIPYLVCGIVLNLLLSIVTIKSFYNILRINKNSKKCINNIEIVKKIKDKEKLIQKNKALSNNLVEGKKRNLENNKTTFQDVIKVSAYNHNYVDESPKIKKLNKKL